MFDCIIVGSGPAGLSAALNLKIYHKDFLWFGSRKLSDKVLKAEKIVNYPGFPAISGEGLAQAFQNHIAAAGLEITEKSVTLISKSKDSYYVLADDDMFQTRSVILATGVATHKLLENEETFLGKGVSYCATCDGNFYKGKKIAVISNDSKFEHEVEFLADLAQEVLYFPTFESAVSRSNLTISQDVPIAVNGSVRVESLTLKSGETVALDGVFCLRNAVAPTRLFPGLAVENGQITVDRKMQTNLPGVFACGDCTGRPYQYTKAVGEGNVAAHSAISYLAENFPPEKNKV